MAADAAAAATLQPPTTYTNTATPTAQTTAPQAVAPQTHASAPVASAQLSQALTGLHIASGATGQTVIRLQPADLGTVQVRIERAHDGAATITVLVEKAATMHSIQQDLPHLHQALDRAGLPAESRQVTVQLAPASGSDTHSGFGFGNDAPRQHTGSRQPSAPARLPEDATADTEAPNWRPAGLNITA
jgi:flagellar hook-length control protein FliK